MIGPLLLPYPVVSDNPVVVHDGDDEARLSDSVQWDGEHEGFVEDGVQCLLVDGCLLLLHFPNVVHRPHFHVGIHRYGRSLDREQNPSWRRVKKIIIIIFIIYIMFLGGSALVLGIIIIIVIIIIIIIILSLFFIHSIRQQ